MFAPWAGTVIYVPVIWGQQYPLANKGYARARDFLFFFVISYANDDKIIHELFQ